MHISTCPCMYGCTYVCMYSVRYNSIKGEMDDLFERINYPLNLEFDTKSTLRYCCSQSKKKSWVLLSYQLFWGGGRVGREGFLWNLPKDSWEIHCHSVEFHWTLHRYWVRGATISGNSSISYTLNLIIGSVSRKRKRNRNCWNDINIHRMTNENWKGSGMKDRLRGG